MNIATPLSLPQALPTLHLGSYVDGHKGIEEFDNSTGSLRSISNSSNFSQVLFLEGPRIVGLKIEPSPEVVVYDENIDPVLQWPGSAIAVAILLEPTTPLQSSHVLLIPSATSLEISTSASIPSSTIFTTSQPQLTSLIPQPQLTSVIPQPQLTTSISPTNSMSPSPSSDPMINSPALAGIVVTAVALLAFAAASIATVLM